MMHPLQADEFSIDENEEDSEEQDKAENDDDSDDAKNDSDEDVSLIKLYPLLFNQMKECHTVPQTSNLEHKSYLFLVLFCSVDAWKPGLCTNLFLELMVCSSGQ